MKLNSIDLAYHAEEIKGDNMKTVTNQIRPLTADGGFYTHHAGIMPYWNNGEIHESYQLLNDDGMAVASVDMEDGAMVRMHIDDDISLLAGIAVDSWMWQLHGDYYDRESEGEE